MIPPKLLTVVLAIAAFALGCGSIPYRTARNVGLCEAPEQGRRTEPAEDCLDLAIDRKISTAWVPRARKEFRRDDPDVPRAFVGLSISGGGSRAANFGLATLEQLEAIGLLQHVTAISTTSGGGLAGAYYAANGPKVNWAEAAKLMATDFRGRWLFSAFRPDHLVTTALTHADRSDLMADIFDDVLFKGRTYGELGSLRSGAPIFLANATSVDTGARFAFADDVFRATLGSRIDRFPLSVAVMASAAFPGVFNSVTLRKYPVLEATSRQKAETPSAYVHLLDGGPADNLGIESLIELANTHQEAWQGRLPTGELQAPCFFIVVDAFPAGVSGKGRWKPDPRGWFDHAIDQNMFAAFDALLLHRRANLLLSVGLAEEFEGNDSPEIGDIPLQISLDDLGSERLKAIRQVVEVDLPGARLRYAGTPALPRPVGFQLQTAQEVRQGKLPASVPIPPHHFRCKVWHINLSGVLDVKPFEGNVGENPVRLRRDDGGPKSPVLQHRARLKRLVSQIDTDFKLAGPRSCSSKQLQDALYAAAFVLTREDHLSRTQMCDWFEAAGLTVSKECRAFPGNRSLLTPISLRATGIRVDGQPGDTGVDCQRQ